MSFTNQNAMIYENSCRIIPGGVNSPVRSFRHLGITPIIAKSGRGAEVIDVEGNRYIDYCGSWGALILGHAHEKVVQAVQNQVALGSSFGMATEIEYLLAKKIVQCIPFIEKIRFVSSGTEATMSAIRLARGYTGRDKFVKFHGNYHGHADGFLVRAGSGVTGLGSDSSSAGIPKGVLNSTVSLPFNDLELCSHFLREHRDEIAAVILEPIAGNMGVVPATQEFIDGLRQVTTEIGALLIFDEVISGFRVGLRGASGLYGVEPDLICLGKIMGGGFPAAAFGGKEEIMNCLAPLGNVYQAGTLSGNPIAMRAGLTTLEEIEKEHFYQDLQDKVDFLLNPIHESIQSSNYPMALQSVGSMFTLFFGVKQVENSADVSKINTELFKEFFIAMLDSGIYLSPAAFEACFVSEAHTYEQLLITREAILDFIAKLQTRSDQLLTVS